MEQVLDVYRCPYDCECPALCVGRNHHPGHIQSEHPSSGCVRFTRRSSRNTGQNAWGRFEFVYMSKHGRCPNVAEAQISVMSRQCLNRRIDSIDEVRSEIGVWRTHRDWIQAKVDWQFTSKDARIRLKRFYPTLEE